ncbi:MULTISPECIES: pentapeptide repeat-containing protein [Alphaproteobacteria]|uniref:pentapeptide repeat-containing protein n=1 Tax=Alphaproteobacteria TaxID=28211 RepID=UPI0032630CDC
MSDVGRKIIDRIEARRIAAAARAAELAAMPNKHSQLSRTLGRVHQGIVRFEPYGIILAAVGLILTFGTIVLDLEDRQSERIFKGWEILALDHPTVQNSSAKRQALEFLNRKFDGRFCSDSLVPPIIRFLNGNASRRCLIPAKAKEAFPRLVAEGTQLHLLNLPGGNLLYAILKEADLWRANLSGANLRWVIGLTQAQLGSACGVPSRLPQGLTPPDPCPEPAPL